MFASNSRTIPLALALLALASTPSLVRAQGNQFNPYGNSGLPDYREFSTPMYSNNPALPGQSRLDQEPLIGRTRSNSFQRYIDELDDLESGVGTPRRESTSRLPYYEAYQLRNRQNNRVYKPNDTPANQAFLDRQQQRETAYAKALEEKDPAKRSRLLRQLDQEALQRPLSSTRTKPSSTPATGGTARSTTGTAGAARGTAAAGLSTAPPPPTGDRRSSAPPPSSTTDSRRPNSATNRAPAAPRAGASGTPAPNPGRSSTPTDPSTIAIPPPR
jgi:hypothetical protein